MKATSLSGMVPLSAFLRCSAIFASKKDLGVGSLRLSDPDKEEPENLKQHRFVFLP
jgi:hypothetical protein